MVLDGFMEDNTWYNPWKIDRTYPGWDWKQREEGCIPGREEWGKIG